MEKDRSSKVIAIVALVIAVLGVSLGFAAISQNLVIQPTAEVKGDKSKFNVQFSTNDKVASTGTVTATLKPENGIDGFEASTANLIATTVSNLKATFVNGKGSQTATYSFYVYNAGELDAYLKKVTFEEGKPTCTPVAGETAASQELVDEACKDVTLKITVDGTEYAETTDVSNKVLKPVTDGNTAKSVTVVLSYSDANPVDGDFEVTFGNITLNYSSSDGE